SIRGFTFIPTAPQGEAQTVPPPHSVELGTVCSSSQSYRTFAVLKDVSESEVTKNETFSKEGARVCRKIQKCLDYLPSFCQKPECWGEAGFRFARLRIPNTFETANLLECGGDVFKRCQDILTKHLSAPKAPPVWMPKDLWMKTFSFLEDPNLISASHVSKEWRAVIQEICKERFSKEYSFYPINPLLDDKQKYLQAKRAIRTMEARLFYHEEFFTLPNSSLTHISAWKTYFLLIDSSKDKVSYLNTANGCLEEQGFSLRHSHSAIAKVEIWNNTLIIANSDSSIDFYDLNAKAHLSTFSHGPTWPLWCGSLKVVQDKLAIACAGRIKIIDLPTQTWESTIFLREDLRICAIQAKDHNLILHFEHKSKSKLKSKEPHQIQIFDLQNKKNSLYEVPKNIACYELLESTLLLGTEDGTIIFRDLNTLKDETLQAYEDDVYGGKHSVNVLKVFQGLLISSGENGLIKIWDLKTPRYLASYQDAKTHNFFPKNLIFIENNLFFTKSHQATRGCPDKISFHRLNFVASDALIWEDIANRKNPWGVPSELEEINARLLQMPASQRKEITEIFIRWTTPSVQSYLNRSYLPAQANDQKFLEQFILDCFLGNEPPLPPQKKRELLKKSHPPIVTEMKNLRPKAIRHYLALSSIAFKTLQKALDEKWPKEDVQKIFQTLPKQLQGLLANGMWLYAGMPKNHREIDKQWMLSDPLSLLALAVKHFIEHAPSPFENHEIKKKQQEIKNFLSSGNKQNTSSDLLNAFNLLSSQSRDMIKQILWVDAGIPWNEKERGGVYAENLLQKNIHAHKVLKAAYKFSKMIHCGLEDIKTVRGLTPLLFICQKEMIAKRQFQLFFEAALDENSILSSIISFCEFVDLLIESIEKKPAANNLQLTFSCLDLNIQKAISKMTGLSLDRKEANNIYHYFSTLSDLTVLENIYSLLKIAILSSKLTQNAVYVKSNLEKIKKKMQALRKK
ncbi:MAG: F-box protein, partial [Anaerolineae bacterium]